MGTYALRIADLLQRRGDIEAQRQQNSGQVWGHAMSSLAQIPGQVLQQRQQEQDADQRRQVQASQLATEGLQQQVAKGQIATAQQRAQQDQQLRQLFARGIPTPDDLMAAVGPERGGAIAQGLAAFQEIQTKQVADARSTAGRLASGVKALSPDLQARLWPSVRKAAIEAKLGDEDSLPTTPRPDFLDAVIEWSLSPAERETHAHNQAVEQQATATFEEAKATNAATRADRTADNERQAAANAEAARHNKAMEARPVAGASAPDEAEAIADAIIRGEQSPETTGLYRVGPQVRAQLAKKGYNQAQAITDWKATQKHVASLNGAQQLRMQQAIDNAAHSLDVIDTLADQWKGGKFPAINGVQLKAAKAGALGPEAQQIATQLEAQISDVTSELGNVYMGGNSPTDHALGLAAKNLQANWTEATLKTMTKLARTNLQIRANSMKTAGVQGASAGNQYATPTSAPKTSAPAEDPLGLFN